MRRRGQRSRWPNTCAKEETKGLPYDLLTPHEQLAPPLRCGLGDSYVYLTEKIGEAGLSRERVRQLKAQLSRRPRTAVLPTY